MFVRRHYLFQDRGYCVYYPSNILQRAWKIVNEQLTEWSVRCVFWVFSDTNFMNKKISPFFCNNHKTLSHLEMNFLRRLIVTDGSFENWVISLGWYSRISPSVSCGIFDHMPRLDQSRTLKHIWWIVNIYIYKWSFT